MTQQYHDIYLGLGMYRNMIRFSSTSIFDWISPAATTRAFVTALP